MTPAVYSLAVYRGDSYHWSFRCWQDAAKTVPSDLTGVVPKAEIRDAPGGTVVLTLAVALTLPNIIDISLSATASKTFPPTGVWDLQLTYPSGDVRTVVAGTTSMTPDVTDSTGVFTGMRRVAK